MAEQDDGKPTVALMAIGDALKASEARDMAVERIGEGVDAIKGGVEIGKTMRELPPVKLAADYQAGIQELSEKSGHQDRQALENAFKRAETDSISRYTMLEAGSAMAAQGMQVNSADELAELSLVLTRYSESKGVAKDDSAKLMAALYKSGTTDPKAMADAMARISQVAQQAGVGQGELARALPDLLAKQQPGKEALPAAVIAALKEKKNIDQEAAAAEWSNVRIADGSGAEDLRFKHRAHVERSDKTSKQLWQEADSATNRAMGNIGDALRPISDTLAKALAGAANGLASLAAQAPGTVAVLGGLGAAAATAVAAFKVLRGGKQIVGGVLDYVGGFGKVSEPENKDGVQDVRVINWPGKDEAPAKGAGGRKSRRRGGATAKRRAPRRGVGDATGKSKPEVDNGNMRGNGKKRKRSGARDVGAVANHPTGQGAKRDGRAAGAPGKSDALSRGPADGGKAGGGGPAQVAGKATGTLGKLGGFLQKVPGVGVGLRLASLGHTLLGPGSKQEKLEAASGASGAVAGTFVGGAIGGTIGALIAGPIGLPVGKAIGGLIGGLAGEFIGRKLASPAKPGESSAQLAPAAKGIAAQPTARTAAASATAAGSVTMAAPSGKAAPTVASPGAAPVAPGGRAGSSQFNYAPQITINVPAMAHGMQGLAEQVANLLYERFRRADAAAARGMLGDQPFPLMGRA